MLQCVAVCSSVLQCDAVCCSVLQCVAVCCSVLQCVAVCCSVLLRFAPCKIKIYATVQPISIAQLIRIHHIHTHTHTHTHTFRILHRNTTSSYSRITRTPSLYLACMDYLPRSASLHLSETFIHTHQTSTAHYTPHTYRPVEIVHVKCDALQHRLCVCMCVCVRERGRERARERDREREV